MGLLLRSESLGCQAPDLDKHCRRCVGLYGLIANWVAGHWGLDGRELVRLILFEEDAIWIGGVLLAEEMLGIEPLAALQVFWEAAQR